MKYNNYPGNKPDTSKDQQAYPYTAQSMQYLPIARPGQTPLHFDRSSNHGHCAGCQNGGHDSTTHSIDSTGTSGNGVPVEPNNDSPPSSHGSGGVGGVNVGSQSTVGQGRIDQVPARDALIPLAPVNARSVAIQAWFVGFDPDLPHAGITPHHIFCLERLIHKLLDIDCRSGLIQCDREYITFYEPRPGRTVAMARCTCNTTASAQSWVTRYHQSNREGFERPAGAWGHVAFEEYGIVVGFQVTMWDDRILRETVATFTQTSRQADGQGFWLKGMRIRWFGFVTETTCRDAQTTTRQPRTDWQGPSSTPAFDHISQGRDVRTSVMVRNIPNSMTTYELIAVLNKAVYGRYDFVYLRYDFNRLTNVGYGFVNLIHPMDILELLAYFKKSNWPNSNRKPECTYATIQGREALVEKFRNSAVMLQFWEHRPHLFHALDDGELCSMEMPFPEPDNVTKMRRSEQNAHDIGLFPPTAPGPFHVLDAHGRQNEFDRGSSMANAAYTRNLERQLVVFRQREMQQAARSRN